jgi:hypothetical protein
LPTTAATEEGISYYVVLLVLLCVVSFFKPGWGFLHYSFDIGGEFYIESFFHLGGVFLLRSDDFHTAHTPKAVYENKKI